MQKRKKGSSLCVLYTYLIHSRLVSTYMVRVQVSARKCDENGTETGVMETASHTSRSNALRSPEEGAVDSVFGVRAGITEMVPLSRTVQVKKDFAKLRSWAKVGFSSVGEGSTQVNHTEVNAVYPRPGEGGAGRAGEESEVKWKER